MKKYSIFAGVALLTFSFMTHACAQNAKPESGSSSASNAVQASATEEITIDATLVRVILGIQVDAPTAQAASKKASEQANSVLTWLKSAAVNKLKTQGISLYPQYSYNNNVNKLTGYQATNTISFEAGVDKAGEIVDKAIEQGATRIDSISFSAEDVELTNAKLRAIEKATISAKSQAEYAAKAVGLPVKRITEILVNAENRSPFTLEPQMRMQKFSADSSSSTPIQGGELQVSATVSVKMDWN